MSAILPPAKRVWWKEPLDRVELTWILIAFAWAMVLFFMMPYWHAFGRQNLSNEAYRISAEAFSAKAQAMVDKYTVREETEQKIPVVHPPEGSDVYLIARLWQWWPILELENGKSYRLHLSAMDYQHGFSLQPSNINLQVVPGYEMVITVTPNQAGNYSIVCNEYCGLGHHQMVSRLYVK
ncbi:MAG: cytochrome C oxidase subunit II [Burkholderiales bacterium]|jgi:cytochrome c oxidase subunit 2|nr:cytochrome C oxidase subunit II [Burkholderiales bacterium]